MANDSTTVLPPIPWWLVGAAVVLFAVALPKPLAIDEESYLWLGRNVAFDNPYGWTRAWPGGEGFMYAHPPLHLWFMRLVSPLTSLPWIRLSALPWVVLWAASSALWIRRTCHHPHVAAIAWLGSTTVVLGLQDSVMIDLPYVALGTAALAAYREGLTDRRVGWMLAAGLAFGLAVETKYPAAALGFVFALHSWHYGAALAFWAPAAAIIGGTEAWLYTVHGRWHPAVVWETRALIPRGDLAGRVLGTFARGALLPATPALLLTRPVHAAVGLGLAVGALAWARPAGLSAGNVVFLLVCAALGAMALSRAAAGLFASPLRRRKGDRGDGLLLGGAVVTTFVGVMVFHNFASARYLLPAATPLAILLARSAEDVSVGKRVQVLVSSAAGLLAVALALADWQFAAAGESAAQKALVSKEISTPGLFLGEWSGRATLDAAGWTRATDLDSIPLGDRVIVLSNSGGAVPATWQPLEVVEVKGGLPLRVVAVRDGIGLYAETLGPLPFGVSGRALESAVIYEVAR